MNPCEGCALRLFNTKHHNLNGVGSPIYGNMIVVPNVDYDAYKLGDMSFSKQVEIIQHSISSTGVVDVLDNVYIVPLIRCNTNLGCEINNDIYKLCIKHLIEDINKYNIKHLLFLGESARKVINCNPGDYLDYIMMSKFENGFFRTFNVNYSPFIKYTDENRFNIFKKYLIKWYNYAVHHYNDFQSIIEI